MGSAYSGSENQCSHTLRSRPRASSGVLSVCRRYRTEDHGGKNVKMELSEAVTVEMVPTIGSKYHGRVKEG